MGRVHTPRRVGAVVGVFLAIAGVARAQVYYGPVPPRRHPGPYVYRVPGGYPRAQTVTDYQSLINAITMIPGWYGPPAHAHTPAVRPRPAVPRESLLTADGTILWPPATPNDPGAAPYRRAAEATVRAVVREHAAYGHADNRRVADARNQLTAFAGHALPALKARDPAAADGLERFIVELQKTLATLALNY